MNRSSIKITLATMFSIFTLGAQACGLSTSSAGSPQTYSCNPGETIEASCGCGGLGFSCSGDPTLSMCDTSVSSCERSTAFEYSDDSCGRCPHVTGSCPSNGRVTVRSGSFGGSSYSCSYDVVGQGGRTLSRSGI